MKRFAITILLAAFAIAVPSQAQYKKPKEQPKVQPKEQPKPEPREPRNNGGGENRGGNENRNNENQNNGNENRGNENRGNENNGNVNRNNGRRVIPNNYPRDARGHAFNTNRFGAGHPFRFGGVGRYYAFQGRQFPEFFWGGFWFGPNAGFYPVWFLNGPSFYIILGTDGNWYAVNSYDNTQYVLLYVNPDGSDTGDDVDNSDQGDQGDQGDDQN